MIKYLLIPIGMYILVMEGILGFLTWLLVEVPKNAVSKWVEKNGHPIAINALEKGQLQ